jgi:uncharacterized protein
MNVVYLHGFASSPNSSKAKYFKTKLEAAGIPVEVPRLDGGDFEHLTITGQLKVIDEAVAGRDVVLFGSSLGGYLASLYAVRHTSVRGLVLLAPAFQFPSLFRRRYSPSQLSMWKQMGSTTVFHYGENREMRLRYQFLQDAMDFEDEPAFPQPGLIFHGTKDEVVPYSVSQQFLTGHANVQLHLLDSGHELTNVLDPIWERIRATAGAVFGQAL